MGLIQLNMAQQPLKLLVRNLNYETSAETVGHLFERYGPVYVFSSYRMYPVFICISFHLLDGMLKLLQMQMDSVQRDMDLLICQHMMILFER